MASLEYGTSLPVLTLLASSLVLTSSLSSPYTSLTSPYPSLRNISLYPPCARDSDCTEEHKCMQYMCYPWKTSTGFRWCSKDEDCEELTAREEGDGSDGLCFRHPDRENIMFGICLKKIETKQCWSHGDCPRHLRCTNGWCGDPSYHQALTRRPCEDDSVCEQLLTGEMCCYDLSGLGAASLDPDSWSRRCCDNPSGHPVLRPEQELSPQQMKKLDRDISVLAPMFLDTLICEGLPYPLMARLPSCQLYTTTSTTADPRTLASAAAAPARSLLAAAVTLVLALSTR